MQKCAPFGFLRRSDSMNDTVMNLKVIKHIDPKTDEMQLTIKDQGLSISELHGEQAEYVYAILTGAINDPVYSSKDLKEVKTRYRHQVHITATLVGTVLCLDLFTGYEMNFGASLYNENALAIAKLLKLQPGLTGVSTTDLYDEAMCNLIQKYHDDPNKENQGVLEKFVLDLERMIGIRNANWRHI